MASPYFSCRLLVEVLRVQGLGPVAQRKLPVGGPGRLPQRSGLAILFDRSVEALLTRQREAKTVASGRKFWIDDDGFAVLPCRIVVELLRAQGLGPVAQRKLPVGGPGRLPQRSGLAILFDRSVEALLTRQREAKTVASGRKFWIDDDGFAVLPCRTPRRASSGAGPRPSCTAQTSGRGTRSSPTAQWPCDIARSRRRSVPGPRA